MISRQESKRFREAVYEIMKQHGSPVHISDVYIEVKERLSELCNDSTLCIHAGRYYGQPEWKQSP